MKVELQPDTLELVDAGKTYRIDLMEAEIALEKIEGSVPADATDTERTEFIAKAMREWLAGFGLVVGNGKALQATIQIREAWIDFKKKLDHSPNCSTTTEATLLPCGLSTVWHFIKSLIRSLLSKNCGNTPSKTD